MRDVSQAFQAHLTGETTHLCQCWKVLRRDGHIFGFTDHDETLIFDGIAFVAETGLQGQARDERLGLAPGQADFAGAFTKLVIEEAVLADGLFDGASVETWLVDWYDPSQRLLMNVETMGDVRRSDHGFSAGLRSLADVFEQETGRRFLKSCSADLGDTRCGVKFDQARFRIEADVAQSMDGSHFTVKTSGISDRWLTGGRMRILSGVQAGAQATVRAHRQSDDEAHITLWTALADVLEPGTKIELRAGCDKSFMTCGEKFSNRINFRGFPHIPGNDLLMATPATETVMDGRSLFR